MNEKTDQIKEMTKIIDEMYNVYDTTANDIAEGLYSKGYRKVLLDTENGKAVDCVQYAPWQLIEGYTEREVKKARKETAKEILKILNEIGGCDSTDEYFKGWDAAIDGVYKAIKEKFGVEV